MKRCVVVGFLCVCLGVGLFAQGVQESKPTELLISAAASTTDCIEELGALFESKHPEALLRFNFASSGSLQQQIEQGAPVDVFLSAGQRQMKALVDKDLMLEGSVRDLLENKVVLITPLSGVSLDSFEGLTQTSITKIGVGDPQSVPAGQYAKQVFDSLELTQVLSDK
ncbi:MAG: molybdate ABC transporter substrate-binding protein, partial [Sphaerochaetaceae bacterium]